MPVTRFVFLFCLVFLLAASRACYANESDLTKTAVPQVQDGRLTIETAAGSGVIPLHVTRDWDSPEPDVTRALIVIHGWPRRDLRAGAYAASKAGVAGAHTMVITPQFLTVVDVAAHDLSPITLRWGRDAWHAGYDALDPAPISSFAVIDTIFQRLANRTLFPNLQQVVLAGHSAGGQFVQRYAAVGRGDSVLIAQGIRVRYVVANPSTYLYFNDKRPVADGGFARPATLMCKDYDRWNFGLGSKLPPYIEQPVSASAIEHTYLARDIVYLLGTADDDLAADGMDTRCGAEAQGPTRYTRGLAYFRYLSTLGPKRANQRLMEIPGVAHDSGKMYTATCGLNALFDIGSCKSD